MTPGEVSYWTAVAQVLPVFGLAVVIEARTLLQSWTRLGGVGRGDRRIQIAILSVAALGVALGTVVALTALRDNEAPGPFGEALVNYSLGGAIGGTLVSPIVTTMMHSESRAFSRVTGWSPTVTWLLWQVRRKQSKNLGRIIGLRQKSYNVLRKSERTLSIAKSNDAAAARLRNDIDLAEVAASLPEDHPFQQVVAEFSNVKDFRRGVRENLDEVVQTREEAYRDFRRFVCYEQNSKLYNREYRLRLRDLMREEREGRAKLIARLFDPVAGIVRPLDQTLIRAAPDDGGFLTTAPSIVMPDLDPLDSDWTFMTDPAELYAHPTSP